MLDVGCTFGICCLEYTVQDPLCLFRLDASAPPASPPPLCAYRVRGSWPKTYGSMHNKDGTRQGRTARRARKFQWYLRNGAKVSPQQTSHIPHRPPYISGSMWNIGVKGCPQVRVGWTIVVQYSAPCPTVVHDCIFMVHHSAAWYGKIPRLWHKKHRL